MTTDSSAGILAKHLDKALRHFYGVIDADDDNYDATLKDPDIKDRFYCPHCGGAGIKKDKVTHDPACWYHNARSALFAFKRGELK